MSGFNFGNTPGTSAGTTGGLFGSAGAKNDGKSLFGSNAGSSGWTFGQTPTSAPGSDNQPQTSNLFGSGGSSSGNLFGSMTEDKSANANKPAFGGFTGFGGGTQQTPGTPAQPPATTGLFGSTTPAPSSSIFGKTNSTTPAGQPPTSNPFGASTGATTQAQSGTTPAFSFGKPPATSSTQQPATQTSTQQGGSGMFSNLNKPSAGSIFSNPNQTGDTSSKSGDFKGFSFQKPAETSQQSAATGFSFTQPKKDDKPAVSTAPSPSGFSFPSGTSSALSSAQTEVSRPTPTNANPFAQQSTSSQPPPNLFSPPTTTPSSGNMFAKPAAPASASTEAPKTGGFTFPSLGSATPASTAAQTSTTPAPAKPLFPGLGGSTPASTTAATPSLFNLGGPTTSSATPATTAPAPLFNLGGSTTSSATPATAAPKPPFNLGGATTSSSAAAPSTTTAAPAPSATAAAPFNLGASTLNASTAGPTAPVQSRLRNKTMDEILTRWASDLTRYTKEFKNHAETIAHWDQIIVDNSSKIDKLYVKTRTCEKQTMSVEMQLSAVENQQNELEAWLNKYENDVDEMLAKDGSQTEPGGPDQERERTYQLAERLGERLDDMGRDLQSMVEEVNAANGNLGKTGKADEPITQIVKILNSHLSQLQAIDQGTTALQAKVAAAQKAASSMSYLQGSLNGDSQAAVDGFYRSFMGRR